MKGCRICKVSKEPEEYYKDKSTPDGLHSYCKVCLKDKSKRYYHKNKERGKIVRQEHYENNKDTYKEKAKSYVRNNRGKVNAYHAERRAFRIAATPDWSEKEKIKQMYDLAATFNSFNLKVHVDHIIPLQSKVVCGLHVIGNLQILPASENMRKGNSFIT